MKWLAVAALLLAGGLAYSLQPADTQLVFVMEELVVDGAPVTDAKSFRGSLHYAEGTPANSFATMVDPLDGGERAVPLDRPVP
jgi:hypothetical protein